MFEFSRLIAKLFLAGVLVSVLIAFFRPSSFENKEAEAFCQDIIPNVPDSLFVITKDKLHLHAVFGTTPYTKKISGNWEVPINEDTFWCVFQEVKSDEVSLNVEVIAERKTSSNGQITPNLIFVSFSKVSNRGTSGIYSKDYRTGYERRTNSPLAPPKQ